MSKNNPLSKWKQRLIRADIDRYLMGQVTQQQIAKDRGVTETQVRLIADKVIYEKIKTFDPD